VNNRRREMSHFAIAVQWGSLLDQLVKIARKFCLLYFWSFHNGVAERFLAFNDSTGH
jgi:hypothetical protein